MVPFLLLAMAEGMVAVLAVLRSGRAQAAAAALALAGIYLAGPVPGYLYDPNQFMTDQYFQFDYDRAYNPYFTVLPQGPVPDFYRRLGRRAKRRGRSRPITTRSRCTRRRIGSTSRSR